MFMADQISRLVSWIWCSPFPTTMVVKQSCRSINSAALSNVLQSSGTRTESAAVALIAVAKETGVDVVVSPAVDGKDDDCAAPATKLDI